MTIHCLAVLASYVLKFILHEDFLQCTTLICISCISFSCWMMSNEGMSYGNTTIECQCLSVLLSVLLLHLINIY